MQKLKFLLFFIFCGFVTLPVEAAIYIEIKGGQIFGIPIAIVPFKVAGGGAEGENIARIIRNDLENSGQFKTSTLQNFNQFPSERSAVQYPYWKSLGAENLVIGRIQKTSGLRYSVIFELLDVIRAKSDGVQPAPLLAMRFDNVDIQTFRALAHHISDLIFEKLIGLRGFFSTRIAYVSVVPGTKSNIHTLEVADFDGFNPKPLFRSSFPVMSPAWSPDGRKIAFVSFEKDRASVNVVDVQTGNIERITQFPGLNNAPAWSPDGRNLAVVLSKDGTPKIYSINLASKQITRLTDGSGIDTEPHWSSDGRSIVFTSNRGGKPQIYRVTLASGEVQRLTFIGDYNARPTLTPDGKRLVMLHRNENGLFSIAVQALHNGELKVLTKGSLNDSPTLAPNGMMVLYGAQEGTRGVLGAVSLDGNVKIRLPLQEGDVKAPAWGPLRTF